MPLDAVVTKRGSRVGDLVWDMAADHDALGLVNWSDIYKIDGVVIGNTGEERFRPLINALQQSVAARWHYASREDGDHWNAKRAAHAVAAARRFVVWLAASGINTVDDIDEGVILAWRDAVRSRDDTRERSYRDQRVLLDPPLLLWRMRSLVDRTLPEKPEGTTPADYIDAADDTDPIPLVPQPILEHVIGAAHRYVAIYSQDIRAARKYLEELGQKYEITFQRPIPHFKKNDARYAHYDKWIANRFGWKKKSARDYMIDPAPWNSTGFFLIDPDTGEPWLESITTRHHLQQLENSLRTACYILIAFLTGGRNNEMIRLRTTGWGIRIDETGRVRQGYIGGVVTKHRGAGQDVEWGVPEIAITAAGLLLDMSEKWRNRTGSDRLLVTQTGGKIGDALINNDLKVFLERVGAPYVKGKPFPISTHQFRVALAQWLGAGYLGELAGAFHLKQLSTAAFRGYLRSDAEFRSLVETFEMQSSADHLEMILNEPYIGGRMGEQIMAARAPERQAEIDAQVRITNLAQAGQDAPSARTMAKYKKAGRPVYLTAYSTCVFTADAAECLKGVPENQRDRPITHRCSPLTCANSVITRLQVPAYLEDCEAYAAIAIDPNSSSSQVMLAEGEMARLTALMAPYLPVLKKEFDALDQALEVAEPLEASTVALKSRRSELNNILCRLDLAGVLGAEAHG